MKKDQQRIATRSKMARLIRQSDERDKRDLLEDVVPGTIRPSSPITTIFRGRVTTPVR